MGNHCCHSIRRHTHQTNSTLFPNVFKLYNTTQQNNTLITPNYSNSLHKSLLYQKIHGNNVIEMANTFISLLNKNEITENLYQLLLFPYLYDFAPNDEKQSTTIHPNNNSLNSFQIKFFSTMNEKINELFGLYTSEEKNKYTTFCSLFAMRENNNNLIFNTTQGSDSSDLKCRSYHKKLTTRTNSSKLSAEIGISPGILMTRSSKLLKLRDSFRRGSLNKINEAASPEKEKTETGSFCKNKKEEFPQIKEELSKINESRKVNKDHTKHFNARSGKKKISKDKKKIYSILLRQRNIKKRNPLFNGKQIISPTSSRFSFNADQSHRKILSSEGVVALDNNLQINWDPFLMKHEKSLLNYLRENLSPSPVEDQVQPYGNLNTRKKENFLISIKDYYTTEKKEKTPTKKKIQGSTEPKKVKTSDFSGTFIEYVDKYLELDVNYRMKINKKKIGDSSHTRIQKRKRQVSHVHVRRVCNTAVPAFSSNENSNVGHEECSHDFSLSDSDARCTATLIDEKSLQHPRKNKREEEEEAIVTVANKIPYERAFTFKDGGNLSTVNTENDKQINSPQENIRINLK